jgi:hypothetical protein
MPSFKGTLDDLIAAIRTYGPLKTFCREKWNKTLVVKKMFKFRTEIKLEDLPLIFVTRPNKKSGSSEATHTARLYCGFHQPDREVSQDEMIEFEELIEEAVIIDKERNKLALYTEPKQTITDEGYFHPVYFCIKEINIEVIA